MLRIGCLAWGSLVWEPRDLPLASEWRTGGPHLPIEFSRVGDHHELATALCPGAERMPTRWAELRCADLEQARESLREREEIPRSSPQFVGSAAGLQASNRPLISPRNAFCGEEIATWGRDAGLSAIVWTALPPRFNGVEGRTPTAEEALSYLQSLRGDALQHARRYLEQAPPEIRTAYRREIERRLGWRVAAGG